MPFGVSFSTLVLGGMCFFGGSCARTGLCFEQKLDGSDPVTLQYFFRSVAMLLCTIPLAAVASCVSSILRARYEDRGRCGFRGLLLIMGVRGPEGLMAYGYLDQCVHESSARQQAGRRRRLMMAEHVDHKITLFSKVGAVFLAGGSHHRPITGPWR